MFFNKPAAPAATTVAVRPERRGRSECVACHPLLWVKGAVFKRTNLAADARLRSLLEMKAEQPPAKVQAALCNAGYHTTRKEIMNYRERMAMKAKMAPDVEPQEMLLAIAEASPDGPPNA